MRRRKTQKNVYFDLLPLGKRRGQTAHRRKNPLCFRPRKGEETSSFRLFVTGDLEGKKGKEKEGQNVFNIFPDEGEKRGLYRTPSSVQRGGGKKGGEGRGGGVCHSGLEGGRGPSFAHQYLDDQRKRRGMSKEDRRGSHGFGEGKGKRRDTSPSNSCGRRQGGRGHPNKTWIGGGKEKRLPLTSRNRRGVEGQAVCGRKGEL